MQEITQTFIYSHVAHVWTSDAANQPLASRHSACSGLRLSLSVYRQTPSPPMSLVSPLSLRLQVYISVQPTHWTVELVARDPTTEPLPSRSCGCQASCETSSTRGWSWPRTRRRAPQAPDEARNEILRFLPTSSPQHRLSQIPYFLDHDGVYDLNGLLSWHTYLLGLVDQSITEGMVPFTTEENVHRLVDEVLPATTDMVLAFIEFDPLHISWIPLPATGPGAQNHLVRSGPGISAVERSAPSPRRPFYWGSRLDNLSPEARAFKHFLAGGNDKRP